MTRVYVFDTATFYKYKTTYIDGYCFWRKINDDTIWIKPAMPTKQFDLIATLKRLSISSFLYDTRIGRIK